MRDVSLAWQLECQLGEGPAWFADEAVLRFVDIKRGHIHEYTPGSGACVTHDVGGQPSFIVPEEGGGALVGSNLGLYRFQDGRLGERVISVPDIAGNRTNDATVDASGRLWLGTMDDHHAGNKGAVWCLDQRGLTRAGAEAAITNGPAISPDGQWLYHVDTLERTVWRFPLGSRSSLEDGEVIFQLSQSEGSPDGIVVDEEGALWIGLWNGWGVRRYDPSGKLLRHVEMPCANVTKIAFGGEDMSTAFVTTARVTLNDQQLADQPLAGSLFQFQAEVRGLPLPKVRRQSVPANTQGPKSA